MKYSKSNPPIYCLQDQGKWLNGAEINSTPVGVLWHDTAAGNSYIKRYVQPSDNAADRDEMLELLGKNKYGNDWNHSDRVAGVNAFIGRLADNSITTVQTGPWTTAPWGCGSGTKGSCNGYIKDSKGNKIDTGTHWVQFEICDDDYKDKDYFETVFEEACQLTAYICKEYNIDPNGFTIFNGVTVPNILCHADSYKLKLGSNHGDVYSWFEVFGKTMDDVRARVSEILAEDEKTEELELPKEHTPYRVRKSWDDVKTQVGAFNILDNAIEHCRSMGLGYHVFNVFGEIVYSAESMEIDTPIDEDVPQAPEQENASSDDIPVPSVPPVLDIPEDDKTVENDTDSTEADDVTISADEQNENNVDEDTADITSPDIQQDDAKEELPLEKTDDNLLIKILKFIFELLSKLFKSNKNK